MRFFPLEETQNFNGTGKSPSRINEEYDLKIAPLPMSMTIWLPIYFCLMTTTIYQAIPIWMLPRGFRNDDLIFNQIGYVWTINIFSNLIWNKLFYGLGFYVSAIDILVMLSTALYMLVKVSRSHLNKIECVTLYFGISIYAGWVSVATILNLSYIAKDMGLSYENGHDETKWACFILWVAFVIFTAASLRE